MNANTLPKDDEKARDRAVRLFTFLKETSELRTRTVRSVDQYERVIWFDKVPRDEGCYCVAWRLGETEDDSETWIEIKKPKLKQPPKAPEEIEAWLEPGEVEDSTLDYPNLRERIVITVPDNSADSEDTPPQTKTIHLDDHPKIKRLWENYVEEAWWPWAEEDRRLKRRQEKYARLFSLYQKQQRLGEAYEVVLGLGYLTWKTSQNHLIKRHIVTAQTSITFDATRGIIAVGPAGEGAKPILEQDMLEPGERPEVIEQKAIEDQVSEMGDNLWDGVQLQDALKTWANSVSGQGVFEDTLTPQMDTEIDSFPRIHLAPAIILRKRTERNLILVFKDIIEQLNDGQPVPEGVRRLVTIVEEERDHLRDHPTEDGVRQQDSTDNEIYFPLPANKEQKEIAQKIFGAPGLLVQGPPGTGKSQTIANLVCHLLALGKKVLVTSHTARALRVLKGKFPKEIADLCVILLGDDQDSIKSMEDSVHGITDTYNSWSPGLNDLRIEKLEMQLDTLRKEEAEVLNSLRSIREAETFQHPSMFGTYEGTLKSIANQIRNEAKDYSWILEHDEVQIEDEPPLTDKEALKLLELLRELDNEREIELEKSRISPNSLPSGGEFTELVKNEKAMLTRYSNAESFRQHRGYNALTRAPKEMRDQLIDGLRELIEAYESLTNHIQPWTNEAAIQILADRDRIWWDLLDVTLENLDAITDRVRDASKRQVSGIEKRDHKIVKSHALALLDHCQAGKKLGIGPFRPKVVKQALYLIKEVRIDGSLCDTPQTIEYLLDWIEIEDRLNTLKNYWATYTDPPSGSFSSQVAEYKDLCEPLEGLLELHDRVQKLREIIKEIHGLQVPTWHVPDEIRALYNAAEAVRLEEKLREVREAFSQLQAILQKAILKSDAHPVISQLIVAIENRDTQRYNARYNQKLWMTQKERILLEFVPKPQSLLEQGERIRSWTILYPKRRQINW